MVELLKANSLVRVRFSFAFARWDGLGLISESLEEFLGGGGRFECVYGAGNGITTSDALHYGLLLKARYPGRTYSGFIEDEYANALFHPKVCEFRFPKHKIVLIGSANLTGGGLVRNGETMIELSVAYSEPLAKEISGFWKWAKAASTEVTVEEIHRLAQSKAAGREREPEGGSRQVGKPFLKVPAKLAPKPLFAKVLGLPGASGQKKSGILAGMGSLTERPKHLYFQIFERETGGQKGKSGSAVQLPVATLGAYFGLGQDESRVMTFHFPSESIVVNVIHNSNHTHQVRLDPIFSVQRPAIIHFKRTGNDTYRARFVPPALYASTLSTKCTEQTRAGSRRWGMFA
jgi:HKD family nuclease